METTELNLNNNEFVSLKREKVCSIDLMFDGNDKEIVYSNKHIGSIFSLKELEFLAKMKEKVQNEILSRPKGSINVEKSWMIDDSEDAMFNDIPIVKHSQKDIDNFFNDKK